ncbi:hypothetical protein I302_101226 [Kwoniella bestiolae CBS 10118]|uniref:DUF6534 domain-containing protein n=1 Tax=Kwoniella bestiolae CBS 10118 TaxID=1296100 RepID=A0AAJ8M6B3_9TREE
MNTNAQKDKIIDGFDEAAAKELFAKDARFMLLISHTKRTNSSILALWYSGPPCGVSPLLVIIGYICRTSLWTVMDYGYLGSRSDGWHSCLCSMFFVFVWYRASLRIEPTSCCEETNTSTHSSCAGGGIGLTIVFGSQPSLLGADKSGPTIITWTSTSCAADVLIAACILWGLLKSKSGWTHTDRVVTRLIRLTFEAQLPPTFLALSYVIEWSQTPSSLLGAVFQALQSKAYTIGLLFTLNARISFTVNTTDTKSGAAPQVYAMTDRKPTQLEVTVQHETYIHDDLYANNSNNHNQSKSMNQHVAKSDSLSDYDDTSNTVGHENGSRARLTFPEAMA